MERKNKIDMLNVYRIVAFMCVFLLHAKIFIPIQWNEGVSSAWMFYTPAWAGVWMFLFVSGYGIGAGFMSGKYEMSVNGIYRYCISRIKGIVPIYWFYILLVAIFVHPTILLPRRENLFKILNLLFFNYQEEFDSIQYGLSWYLTTLVRLYFVAPIFYWIVKKIVKSRRDAIILSVLIIVLGLLARLAMGYHILFTGENWSVCIYKPFYFNLDIFFVGFLINYMKKDLQRKIAIPYKWISLLALFLLIMYNSYIYYYGSYAGNQTYMDIYCYLLPTAYILVSGLYIYCFDVRKEYRQTKLELGEVKKNPIRILEYFRTIQLPMYLFHSTILLCLQNGYVDEKYYYYAMHLGANESNVNFYKGCIFTVYAFIITLVWSIVVTKVFTGKKSKLWDKFWNFDLKNFFEKMKNLIIKILAALFPLENKR